MESNHELKAIDIKNRMCYYFNDIMRVGGINFSDILWDEKSYENILIYDISYKTFTGAKPLCIWFNKIDGFIKIHDGIRYSVLFGPKTYGAVYDRIRDLITEKSGVTYSTSHQFAKIRIDSYNYLPIEKPPTFHDVIIVIKSVVNKNKNDYYCNIFSEKGSYEDKANIQYF